MNAGLETLETQNYYPQKYYHTYKSINKKQIILDGQLKFFVLIKFKWENKKKA